MIIWTLLPIIGIILLILAVFAVIEVLKIPILIIIGIFLFDIIGNWLGGFLKVKKWISYLIALQIVLVMCYFIYNSWWSIALLGGIVIALYLILKGTYGNLIKNFAYTLKLGGKK